MNNRINLSISYNMSLGFIPVVAFILISEFFPANYAIYAGTLTGIIYSLINRFKKPRQLPNLILYMVTAVMLLFSSLVFFIDTGWFGSHLPITLEVAVVLSLLFIYGFKEKVVNYFRKKPESSDKYFRIQATEVAFVSIGASLALALMHFAILTLYILLYRSSSSSVLWVLLTLSPFLVFAFSMVFNQIGIHYFNKESSGMFFVPVINEKGDVISKIIEEDIPEQKNRIIVPVVRIAVEIQGMLYLSSESTSPKKHSGQTDTPLKSHVFFKEDVSDTVKRILKESLPANKEFEPCFCIKHFFKNDNEHTLIYLFFLRLDDETELKNNLLMNGKLWNLQQIEQNLGKGFFTDCFEYEYEYLKEVIKIRTKYT